MKRGDDGIDLFEARSVTRAEAQRATAGGGAQGFVHSWSTVQAGAAVDVLRGVEHRRELLRIVAFERDADDAGAIVGGLRAVNR